MKLPEWLTSDPRHQKQEQVTDAALSRSIILSVVGILFCMTCLFGLTWAWYSSSVGTAPNVIEAASFDLDITVTESETGDAAEPAGGRVYQLDPAKTYEITLAKAAAATAKSGFCHLSVTTPAAAATAYYTDSIPDVEDDGLIQADKPEQKADKPVKETEAAPYVFTVWGISEIKFTPMWGKCPETETGKVVASGGTLAFDVTAGKKSEPEEKTDDTTAESTASTTTTTGTTSTAAAATTTTAAPTETTAATTTATTTAAAPTETTGSAETTAPTASDEP